MTVYFIRVFKSICEEINWHFKYYEWAELDKFISDARGLKRNRILMTGNRLLELDELPKRYVGSHIIRDPRDLLISGYRYHKWTNEFWANEPMKRGLQLKLMLKEYNLHMEFDNMSYQQLLNSVDQEIGLQIELNWRKKTFEHMMNWDYNNTNIMELSYENIFGNEVETFKELFKHYGFNNEIAEIGLKYVRIYSFENQKISGKTGEDTHLTKGHKGQWKEYFSDDLKRIFKERHQDLLMKLNYEQHGDW